MPSLIKYGRKLLRRGRRLAKDRDCCCECCGCPTLQCHYLLGQQLSVVISGGGFSATCNLTVESAPAGTCAAWSDLDCDISEDICGYNMQDLYLVCPNGNIGDIQFEAGLSNMGCDMIDEAGDPLPYFGAHAKRIEPNWECSESGGFYGRFFFPLDEGFPNGCICSGGPGVSPILFEVTGDPCP